MNTLIIYTIIPDEQIYFVIPDIKLKESDWVQYLDQCAGRTVNIDEMNEGMRWMESAAAPKPEYCSDETDSKYHCCLLPYKVNSIKGEAFHGPFSKVYVTGFFL